MTGPYLPRGLVRAAAGAFFASVFALLFTVSDPAQAGSVMFVVPIALLALSDGLRGGIIGTVVAVVLTGLWVSFDDIHLNVLGWGSRVTGFALIGLLIGRYEDLASGYERRLLDERYAAEVHDRVVQQLVLARYQLDDHPEAQRAVDAALAGAKDIIGSRLPDPVPGELRITADDPPPPP